MTSELTKALVEFHKSVGTIHKTAKSYTNQYAPLDQVLSVVTPALSKAGLVVTQTFEPDSEKSEPVLITTLRHVSGECIESKLPLIIVKGKNALQDLGSSISYSRRYALLAILGLVADVDTDGNAEQPTPAPAETKAEPSPTPKPRAAKKAPEPKESAISADDRLLLLNCLRDEEADKRNRILAAFREQFGLASDAPIKNKITTEVHAAFLREQLAQDS